MMIFEACNLQSSTGHLGLNVVVCLFEKLAVMGNGINLCPVLHWNLN